MAARLIKPPIRTALMNNPDGTPMTQIPASNGSASPAAPAKGAASLDGGLITTQKHWYRYWGDCGDQINANTDKLDKLVTFGTHADRPDPANMPNGALYFESDRNVVYANVNGVWHYVAGTDWGTISPDQRPTDLGVNDAGFDFRTTDQPPREFIWSGGAWVETTAARYGTHAARLAQPVANLAAGALWVETDRGDVIYQLQGTAWHYLAGAMWGTASPDQRPTDLGANDTGFAFYATDQQQVYLWNGTAWVLASPPPVNNSVQTAAATAPVTLTTSPQTIPGTTLSLTKAGTYLVAGVFDFTIASTDVNAALVGEASFVSTPQALLYYAAGSATTTIRATVAQHWIYTVSTVPVSIYLTAFKTGGTGGSTANQNHTTLTALWVSP